MAPSGCGREVPSNAAKLPQRSPSLNFRELLSPYADHTLTIRAYGPLIRAYGERMVGVYPAGSAYAPLPHLLSASFRAVNNTPRSIRSISIRPCTIRSRIYTPQTIRLRPYAPWDHTLLDGHTPQTIRTPLDHTLPYAPERPYAPEHTPLDHTPRVYDVYAGNRGPLKIALKNTTRLANKETSKPRPVLGQYWNRHTQLWYTAKSSVIPVAYTNEAPAPIYPSPSYACR